jgi:hypothetical protein
MCLFLCSPKLSLALASSFSLLTPAALSWFNNSSQVASQAPSGRRWDYLLLQTIMGSMIWGTLFDERTGPVTIFNCLRLETLPNWKFRSSYLYPLGTEWPSYTSRYWVLDFCLLWLSGLWLKYSSQPLYMDDNWTVSPRYRALVWDTQEMSLLLFNVFSLPGKQHVHRAIPK